MNRSSVSLPRPRRSSGRAAVVLTALLGLLVAGAGIASAHVTVRSPDASAGGFGTVVFTVPNESDTAKTTRVRVQIPDGTPLASVSVEAVPGWSVTTTQTTLTKPLKTDDGDTVTSATSIIDFQAAAGGGIPPGQFQEFRLSGGPFPDDGKMTFNVVQTYSDGTEAAWIEPTIQGQPEPDHPAPVLTLTSGSGVATRATAPAPAAASSGTPWQAWLALGIAVVALLVAGAAVLTGRRRTVAS
jgi:periplasmic copper chaperone A